MKKAQRIKELEKEAEAYRVKLEGLAELCSQYKLYAHIYHDAYLIKAAGPHIIANLGVDPSKYKNASDIRKQLWLGIRANKKWFDESVMPNVVKVWNEYDPNKVWE